MTDRRIPYALNIALPLVAGWLFYLLCAPEVWVVAWLPWDLTAVTVPDFFRCHLCDILWAYALTFALALCFPKGKRLPAPCFGVLLAVGMELAVGVFDPWDLVWEAVACTIAYLVILFFDRRTTQ